jgi:hypothetical protein
MTKNDLYRIAEELEITELLEAAAEFERIECEKICKSFAMNERRVEVSAALNRAADLIRLRQGDIQLPDTAKPKDFITYVES